MNIKWLNKAKDNNAVTLYPNNITFCKQISNLLEDAYGIIVGFDIDSKQIVMKKVFKEDILSKAVEKEDMYTISVKPSFARINSKKLITELSNYIKLDFNKRPSYKFNAKWNTGLKMLIINTEEGDI